MCKPPDQIIPVLTDNQNNANIAIKMNAGTFFNEGKIYDHL